MNLVTSFNSVLAWNSFCTMCFPSESMRTLYLMMRELQYPSATKKCCVSSVTATEVGLQ